MWWLGGWAGCARVRACVRGWRACAHVCVCACHQTRCLFCLGQRPSPPHPPRAPVLPKVSMAKNSPSSMRVASPPFTIGTLLPAWMR